MASAGRKAARITTDELRAIIDSKFTPSPGVGYFEINKLLEAVPAIEKDLAKVRFGFDNFENDDRYYEPKEGNLLGYHTINGLSFMGCYAGSDDEIPVYFIIYLDHNNKLRAYLPEDGNLFNTRLKMAIGNAMYPNELSDPSKADHRVLQEVYGYEFDEDDLDEDGYFDLGSVGIPYNWEQLAASINGRISVD